ncbi:MAG: magnesium transporter [Candidatus Acinetobacter avistercoris]|uniref:magnesium transporter n=1 Tax=Acinetobacter sp. KS-LM10 TaxID=3120518 RepID=UPI001FA4E7A5|nr:magnesium transporter [Candidatus Acinetobacter avistercoris]
MSAQDILQKNIISALEQQDISGLLAITDKTNAATLALHIQKLTIEQQSKILKIIPQSAYVFEFFPLSQQLALSDKMDATQLTELISDMHSDERTDLYKALPLSMQQQVFARLNRDKQDQIRNLITYPEQSAGSIMSSDFVTMSPELTMQQAIEQLRRLAPDRETLYLIYITNAEKKLEGVVSLRQIIQSEPDTTIAEIMSTDLVVGRVDEDQEDTAKVLNHYDFIALPIVDHQDHLLGIVTYDDVMDVLEEEFTEDFLKGSAVESSSNLSLKSAPILSLYRQRVFWLVILVFGSLLSGVGIAHFEEIIAANIVLVFFLPLLVGSGGNAGSQSATLMVRAMATGDVYAKDWFKLLGRESLVALCLGATMAFAVSLLGFFRGDEMVALVLALSMMGIVMMGCLIGMSLPFILNKLGLDPASASAPLVTSICDATGVIIYLFIASKLLLNLT